MFTAADGYPVRRQGGTAHIPESGLIFVCVGCCCGHAERGGPKTPPRTLKREMRRAFRDSGMQGRLRLAFTDCLGPCSEANVVFLYLAGRPLWLRRVNNVDVFRRALDWARAASTTAVTDRSHHRWQRSRLRGRVAVRDPRRPSTAELCNFLHGGVRPGESGRWPSGCTPVRPKEVASCKN